MRTKTHRIEFYLDDREYAKLSRAIKKSGLNISTYFRHMVKDRIPQDRPPKDYFDLLKDIRAVSTNIRRIADIAEVTGVIDASRYRDQHIELLSLYLKIIETAEMPRKVSVGSLFGDDITVYESKLI